MCWYRKQDLIIFVLNIFTILVIGKKIEFIFLAISKTFLFFFTKANDVTAKSGLIMKKKTVENKTAKSICDICLLNERSPQKVMQITSSYFLSASSAIHFASVNCFSSWSILSSLPLLRFSNTFLFLSAEYSI